MVSIIIPTYNYARFIDDCLKSVLAQTNTLWECIVVDNSSTDDTTKVCEKYLIDSRFKYILLVENYGPAYARNVGLKVAIGEFILFLDSDDLIERDKLNQAMLYLNNNVQVDLVYSSMRYFIDPNPQKLFYAYQCNEHEDKPWMTCIDGGGAPLVKELLNGNVMVISSPVFRKDVLKTTGLFDEAIFYNEDWDLWLRMALHQCVFKYLDLENTKTLIRTHSKSASKDVLKMQICGLSVLTKNSILIESYGLKPQLQNRIKDHVKAISASLLKLNRIDFVVKLAMIKKMKLYHFIFRIDKMTFFLQRLLLKIYLWT